MGRDGWDFIVLRAASCSEGTQRASHAVPLSPRPIPSIRQAKGFLRLPADDAAPVGRRGRGKQPAAVGALEGGSGGAAAAAAMAELPAIIKLLSSASVVAKRRFRWRTEDQAMVGGVGPKQIAELVGQQLRVALPAELVMLDGPLTDFGEFKVGRRFGVWGDGRGVGVEEAPPRTQAVSFLTPWNPLSAIAAAAGPAQPRHAGRPPDGAQGRGAQGAAAVIGLDGSLCN